MNINSSPFLCFKGSLLHKINEGCGDSVFTLGGQGASISRNTKCAGTSRFVLGLGSNSLLVVHKNVSNLSRVQTLKYNQTDF